MRRMQRLVFSGTLVLMFAFAPNVFADDMAARLHSVLTAAPGERFWQIRADDLSAWITEKRTDFVVVDVRPNPAEYGNGHIPGAIQMPVQNILDTKNLARLPKDKKLILVCVTGQTQNLPVVALRALGYDAYTMAFGYAAWIKGYHGSQVMQEAIQNAAAKNFPLTR
jgi:rhodanese-related sulfurtransferase